MLALGQHTYNIRPSNLGHKTLEYRMGRDGGKPNLIIQPSEYMSAAPMAYYSWLFNILEMSSKHRSADTNSYGKSYLTTYKFSPPLGIMLTCIH